MMPDYERVPWCTEYSGRNLQSLQRHLRERGQGDLADEVGRVAEQPGPLNVMLARCYYDFNATGVVAKFMAAVRTEAADSSAECLVGKVEPLLRWDYGMEPIEWALRETDSVTGDAGPRLERSTQRGVAEAIEALWLLGLYRLVLQPEDPRNPPLTGVVKTGSVPQPQRIGQEARNGLERRLAGLTGPRSGVGICPDERLRLNAAGMLRRHDWLEDGSPGVFGCLLKHVFAGGTWALPCEANDGVRRAAETQGLPGFWREQGTMVFDGDYSIGVGFLSDPLQILNLGNSFDTCLRLGADSEADFGCLYPERTEASILGYATNVNIRIVVARGSDGRILGRRTLGLSLHDGGGLVEAPTYPRGQTCVEAAIDDFVQAFREDAGLRWSRSSVVEPTCAPFYFEFGTHAE